MATCNGRYVDPETGAFLGDCTYQALFDGQCGWHAAVAEGRITTRLEGQKIVPVRARPRGQTAPRVKHPLDRLIEEWG